MIYAVLRWLAGIALRWYYRDVRVSGLERLPREGPLLVAPNHPNALVDALLVGRLLPRRLLITAKATLFANPVAAWAFRILGVLPLRRASDERLRLAGGGAPDRARNEDTFRAVLDALARGDAVLMFPEGKSWDEPHLAPLRSGTARIAVQAREDALALAIVPVGIVFEQKERPRSRVLVQIGDPIRMTAWSPPPGIDAVAALTQELRERLEAVTLNYPSLEVALRERDLAALFAAIGDRPSSISRVRSLSAEVAVARRIAAARAALERGGAAMVADRVDALLERASALYRELKDAGIAPDDVSISARTAAGARFALREGVVFAIGAPIALWGRLHHWLPFRLARSAGRGGTSRADPAMRTIVAGLVLTLAWYALVGFLAVRIGGSGVGAVAYVLSLPLAEDFALRFQERIARARRRMRAYLTFRRQPERQIRLRSSLRWILEESESIERELLVSA